MTSPKDDWESLEHAREALDAIRSGNVDAVVVNGPQGPQLFRLEGPEQPFRAFIERIQEGALTMRNDGTILYANAFFANLVHGDPDELVGAPLSKFVVPEYRATMEWLVRQGAKAAVKGEVCVQTRSGIVPVQLTLSPLTSDSCCGVIVDLRERHKAEQAEMARLAAVEAARAKDQFLAVLSHELRSPLNTILGWAQILSGDPALNAQSRRAADAIMRSAHTQSSLINDLLDISRIIVGKLNLEMAELDFGCLVEAQLVGMEPLVAERQVTLCRALANVDTEVYGDATRLQQIFTNLFNNALKFTGSGGRVEVHLDSDDEWVRLTVSDTGIGMSAELLARIFDVFHQGGSVDGRKGGLGLGLAIARQLAEAHGGTLTAASAGEGGGSSFTLRLPHAKRLRSHVDAFAPDGELVGLRVLIVDDDPDTVELTKAMLERAGAMTMTACNAASALDALSRDAFDLVVSDIGLPQQDGLALMREVRARGNAVPAVAVTGFAGLFDARLVAAAGFQRHLPKPVDASALVRAAAEVTKLPKEGRAR